MTGRASHLPPAPREAAQTNDVWVSLGVAAALMLTAIVIALWPAGQFATLPAQSGAPAPTTRVPVSPTASPGAQSGPPVQFKNPFDPSEVFEFPAGTSQDAARQSVADILLQRARERQAQISSLKQAHRRPSAPFRPSALLSELRTNIG